MIFTTSLVQQKFLSFFFRKFGPWFSVGRSSKFWRSSAKLKKKKSSLNWSEIFLTHFILHDVATTRFNRWLWQWVYPAFSLIFSICVERPLIWPETNTALWQPCPRELLICKDVNLNKISHTDPTHDTKNLKNILLSYHLCQQIFKEKLTEKYDASLAEIETKLYFFISSIRASFMNLPQQ